jgi:glycerol-3-phosphate dehydrogenase
MNSRGTLAGTRFEVLVIGGGINGVAIARECARAGRRTLVVEQNDFAAGTTSRSTRIIHGGLRYLEHGDIAQVRESLRERQRLMSEYPNLVRPLQFVLALNGGSRRSALAVRAALWLYRRFGGRPLASRAQEEESQFERLLDTGRGFSLFSFDDGQCEFPERLVAEWLVEALAAGCIARNHTTALRIVTRNGRATGALLRDEVDGREEVVESDWIINASGPWADWVCQSSSIKTSQPMIGGVRGSHIVLPKFAGAPEAAMYAEAVDGRPIFVLPWNDQTLVGTTEVADTSDPAKVSPSSDEVAYLLTSLRRIFRRPQFAARDIRYAFAGVRPLPYQPGSSLSSTTRRHSFHDHTPEGAAGMISVIGGKLTTAARLARECAAKIGIATHAGRATTVVVEGDLDEALRSAADKVSETGQLASAPALEMVEWYGRRAWGIARMASSEVKLRARLCPHTQHVVAEAVDAFENQCAVTLGDVLLRRVPVALGPCWSPGCSQNAASHIADAMGWNADRTSDEIDRFEQERKAFVQNADASLSQKF